MAAHLFHFPTENHKLKKQKPATHWLLWGVVALPLGSNKIKWQTNLAAHEHEQQQQQQQHVACCCSGWELYFFALASSFFSFSFQIQLTHAAIVSICQALISLLILEADRQSLEFMMRVRRRLVPHPRVAIEPDHSAALTPFLGAGHAQFPFYAFTVQLSDLSLKSPSDVAADVALVLLLLLLRGCCWLSQLNFSGNQAITSCNMPCCTIAFDSAAATSPQQQLISIAFASTFCLIASVAATTKITTSNNLAAA